MPDPEQKASEPVRDNPWAARVMHGLGLYFLISGTLGMVGGLIGLVAVLVTGGDAAGLAISAMFMGSGMASGMIGYALRRLTL